MEEFFKDIANLRSRHLRTAIQCDFCGKDYAYSNAKGGIYILGWFICPECIGEAEKFITEYNIERYVDCRADTDETFRDFVKKKRT